jgi:hypothetical protein
MMGPDAKPIPEISKAADRARIAEEAVYRASLKPSTLKEPTWTRLRHWLVVFSGLSDEIAAEATLWLVRPLLYAALLIGLMIVGINSLYVEKGTIFGAKPVADYLGLVLWGLSSDVASRSLTNLQGGNTG